MSSSFGPKAFLWLKLAVFVGVLGAKHGPAVGSGYSYP